MTNLKKHIWLLVLLAGLIIGFSGYPLAGLCWVIVGLLEK